MIYRRVWMLCVTLAACDPGWHVRNPATATGQLEPACIEAGLRAWMPQVKKDASINNERVDFLVTVPATEPHSMHVTWEQKQPAMLTLHLYALGTQAHMKAVEGFRAVRAEAVANIERACKATVTLGPESCQRCK